jgi:hypothetical protein
MSELGDGIDGETRRVGDFAGGKCERSTGV